MEAEDDQTSLEQIRHPLKPQPRKTTQNNRLLKPDMIGFHMAVDWSNGSAFYTLYWKFMIESKKKKTTYILNLNCKSADLKTKYANRQNNRVPSCQKRQDFVIGY